MKNFITKENGKKVLILIKNSLWLKAYLIICTFIGMYVSILFFTSVIKESMKLDLQLIKTTQVSVISHIEPVQTTNVSIEEVEEVKPVVVSHKPSISKTTSKKEVKQNYMTDYQIAFWLLKSCESLRPKAYWDVIQWTNGWGTKSKQGEVITLREADSRARREFDRVYARLSKRYPNLDRWEKLILTVVDYNVGKFGKQLESAIKSGNREEIAKILKLYIHDAKGNKLDGLVKRRNMEAELLLASEPEKQALGRKIRNKVISQIKKNKID